MLAAILIRIKAARIDFFRNATKRGRNFDQRSSSASLRLIIRDSFQN